MVTIIGIILMDIALALAIWAYLSERAARKEAELHVERLANSVSGFSVAFSFFAQSVTENLAKEVQDANERKANEAFEAMNLQVNRADEFLTKTGK